jgi:GcrA cell cycle regulator
MGNAKIAGFSSVLTHARANVVNVIQQVSALANSLGRQLNFTRVAENGKSSQSVSRCQMSDEAAPYWTHDRTEKLRELWDMGMSASKIALKMGGTTRNAIISKVHRAGMKPRKTDPRLRMPAANYAAEKIGNARRAAQGLPPIEYKGAPEMAPNPPKPSPAATATEGLTLVTFEELQPRMCKWPIGDVGTLSFRFCGCDQVEGRPYCAQHDAISVARAPKRRMMEIIVK